MAFDLIYYAVPLWSPENPCQVHFYLNHQDRVTNICFSKLWHTCFSAKCSLDKPIIWTNADLETFQSTFQEDWFENDVCKMMVNVSQSQYVQPHAWLKKL